MSSCLIFPYGGGGSKWIDLSLREFDVQWLIILADETNKKNFLDEARQIVVDLQTRESSIPIPKRRKFSVVTVPKYPTFADLLGFFRALHQAVAFAGFSSIYMHLDSGLMRWRIALYQCAEEFPELVRKIFIFNKLTAEIEMIQPYRKLNEMEGILLQLIAQKGKTSLSALRDAYAQAYSEKSLSYILKTVNMLATDGLITEVKEGRTKWVELTNLGKAKQPIKETLPSLKEQLAL